MKVIGFHIQKGGVGKTTCAVNVAAELGLAHGRVLVVDADPQGNTTSWIAPAEVLAVGHDFISVLEGKTPLKDAIVQARENLWVLPTFAIGASTELRGWTELNLYRNPKALTRDVLGAARDLGFDFVVFDMSPGYATLERVIVQYCDEVVGILKAEFFSMDGLEMFEAELNKMRQDLDAGFRAEKLILNQVNKSFGIHKAYMASTSTLKYKIFSVGQDVKIPESQADHKTLREHAAKQPANEEFAKIAAAIVNKQPSLMGA
jgi:chromosome partitioning protein